MWIHSGNGFASVKSQGCLCREVVKISVSAEPRSTNGHEGGNFDKRPVLALELFIPEGRYRIRAPLTPLLFARSSRGQETRKGGKNLNYGRKWAQTGLEDSGWLLRDRRPSYPLFGRTACNMSLGACRRQFSLHSLNSPKSPTRDLHDHRRSCARGKGYVFLLNRSSGVRKSLSADIAE
jgi:hypothetical protein